MAINLEDMLSFGVFLAICILAGSAGAIFKPDSWYCSIKKPRWCPPDWLFPLAWSCLYLTIAMAGWLVWRVAGFSGAEIAFTVYGLHMILNFAWSPIFFGLRRIDWAFFEIILFWLTLVATIFLFYGIKPTAAYLLMPYLVWATFAGALNFAVWQLNKGNLSKPPPAN